jgi:dipeptidyl aminopeptidase/acylaminoacyl peptidase
VFTAGVALNPVADLLAHVLHWQRFRPAHCALTAREIGRIPVYTDGPRAGELKDRADWTVHDRRDYMRLKRASPLHHVDRLRAPLLLAHGAGDARCSPEDSRRFAELARRAGAEVEHLEYAGEGHWLAQPDVYIDLLHRAERLFARTLGGRCEE